MFKTTKLLFIQLHRYTTVKYINLLVLLFFGMSIHAQQITGLDNQKIERIEEISNNKFILPAYANTILDAEHYFTENEIKQLNKLIDSINIASKLQLQFAFVTQDYFERDSLKFDQFVDSLTYKWNPGNTISRVLLIVCMQQQTAAVKLSGNKLTYKISRVLNALKDGELNDIDKAYQEDFIALTNDVLTESNLGINLGAKNFNRAITEYIYMMVGKQNLFFDLD